MFMGLILKQKISELKACIFLILINVARFCFYKKAVTIHIFAVNIWEYPFFPEKKNTYIPSLIS